MKRSASQVNIREAFPPVPDVDLDSFEESLIFISRKIFKKDKRHLASLLGAGALSVLGILIFASTIIGAIGGGVVGFFLGHALGRKWSNRAVIRTLPAEKRYLLRISSLVLYVSELKHSSTPSSVKASIIEMIISEFRPAILLQFHDPAIMKQVQQFTKLMRRGYFHLLLLKNLSELQSLIKEDLFPSLCASRLRNSYIPAMIILKKSSGRQLEFVFRMERLLSHKKTIELLQKVSEKDTDLIRYLMPHPKLSLEASANLIKQSRALVDLDMYFTCKNMHEPFPDDFTNKKSAMMLRNRRMSLVMETSAFPHIKKEKNWRLHILHHFSPINIIEEESKDESDVQHSHSGERGINALRYASQQILSPLSSHKIRKSEIEPLNILFDGDLDYIEASSDFSSSSEEMSVVPMQCSPVHTYESDFQRLLEIEEESTEDATWAMTVNKPGTRVFQRKSGESPIMMIKAFCETNYSAETVCSAIWDVSVRVQWDDLFKEFRLIDTQDEYEVLYYMIKTPFGITKRDWVQRRIVVRDYPDPGMIIMHFISIDHPNMPPKKGIIRAETLISGYIIRATGENTCTVTIISQNDIKGLIPKMIVNKVAAKAPADWVSNMGKGCKLIAGY